MAKFSECIDYIIANEGSEYENDPVDRGGCTKFGISLNAMLGLPQFNIFDCEDIRNLTLDRAKQIYYIGWWKFDRIANTRVATKMFDVYVNLRPNSAIRIFQRAANMCGSKLTVDGIYGPETENAINSLNSGYFLAELVDQLHQHYHRIVEKDPTQARFIRGWL